ncbi:hypothetical protein Plhal304r1_c063g0150901 [Plasmopara halstedii]
MKGNPHKFSLQSRRSSRHLLSIFGSSKRRFEEEGTLEDFVKVMQKFMMTLF